jgi:hypothetical protein
MKRAIGAVCQIRHALFTAELPAVNNSLIGCGPLPIMAFPKQTRVEQQESNA